eukprot:jgi/Mesen1/1598/ME000134S00713
MKIKKLIPLDPESRRMIDWMEKGVYDALQHKYLRTMVFAICETEEGPVLEEYSFSFSYGKDKEEGVKMDVARTGDKTGGKTIQSNASENRVIIMKLFYYDDVTVRSVLDPCDNIQDNDHNSITHDSVDGGSNQADDSSDSEDTTMNAPNSQQGAQDMVNIMKQPSVSSLHSRSCLKVHVVTIVLTM